MKDCIVEEEDDKTVLYLPGNEQENKMQVKMSHALVEGEDHSNVLYLPGFKSKIPFHKELRKFLEEEQKASEEGFSFKEEQNEIFEGSNGNVLKTNVGINNRINSAADENPIEGKLHGLDIGETRSMYKIQFPAIYEPENEEDEESRKQRGKGNVEKWLQMLLDNSQESGNLNPQNSDENEANKTLELIRKLDLVYPQKEVKTSKAQELKDGGDLDKVNYQQLNHPDKDGEKREEYIVEMEAWKSYSNKQQEGEKGKEIAAKFRDTTPMKNPPYRLRSEKSNADKGGENFRSYAGSQKKEKKGKEKELARSESARTFRRIPSSPSLIFSGMKKRVDCIGKKPLVTGDDDAQNYIGENNLIKSTIKTIKRAVRI